MLTVTSSAGGLRYDHTHVQARGLKLGASCYGGRSYTSVSSSKVALYFGRDRGTSSIPSAALLHLHAQRLAPQTLSIFPPRRLILTGVVYGSLSLAQRAQVDLYIRLQWYRINRPPTLCQVPASYRETNRGFGKCIRLGTSHCFQCLD